MSKITKYLLFVVILLLLAICMGAFIVLFQSAITIDVIDQSLERHVAQYLIERTTQELVMREVTTLHGWLVLTSSALLVCVGWLIFSAWRKRRSHAKIS